MEMDISWGHQGPISQTDYELIIQILKYSFCSSFNYDNPICSQMCICPDSSIVMICVNLWPDMVITFLVKATYVFYKFWLWALKNVCEMGTRAKGKETGTSLCHAISILTISNLYSSGKHVSPNVTDHHHWNLTFECLSGSVHIIERNWLWVCLMMYWYLMVLGYDDWLSWWWTGMFSLIGICIP